jgi:hypothetical protein
MRCPACRTARLVEIGLTVGERSVVMRSCSACDRRWWQAEGRPARLDRILALAAEASRH